MLVRRRRGRRSVSEPEDTDELDLLLRLNVDLATDFRAENRSTLRDFQLPIGAITLLHRLLLSLARAALLFLPVQENRQ